MQDCYEEVYLKKRDLARGTFYTDGPTIEHLFNEHCSFGDSRSLTVSLLMTGLTDIQRRRVELRHAGYTFREISEAERVSVQAVWQCVRRAGKKIGRDRG
jgi:DNA-directed RNA polymerase specialized sigma24 family protein